MNSEEIRKAIEGVSEDTKVFIVDGRGNQYVIVNIVEAQDVDTEEFELHIQIVEV